MNQRAGFFHRDTSDWLPATVTVVAEEPLESWKDPSLREDRLTYIVTVPGRAPYQLEEKAWVPAGAAGALRGQTLAARAHPSKEDKVEIDWNGSVAASPAAAAPAPPPEQPNVSQGSTVIRSSSSEVIDARGAAGLREEILAALEEHGVHAQPGQTVDVSNVPGLQETILHALGEHGVNVTAVDTSGAATGPAAGDPLDRLEKLGKLREEGLLTDAEFEAAKKKLLDEA